MKKKVFIFLLEIFRKWGLISYSGYIIYRPIICRYTILYYIISPNNIKNILYYV